jgi:hypothetical protein
VNVSASTGIPDDDAYWQRPDPRAAQPRPLPDPAPDMAPKYAGPPRTDPPPGTWRPPVVQQPPPPRSLPAQDIDALDEAEGSAKTVTYGIGLVAAAIAVILMILLCARVIF